MSSNSNPIPFFVNFTQNFSAEQVFEAYVQDYGFQGAMKELLDIVDGYFNGRVYDESTFQVYQRIITALYTRCGNPEHLNYHAFSICYQAVMRLTLAYGKAQFGPNWEFNFEEANNAGQAGAVAPVPVPVPAPVPAPAPVASDQADAAAPEFPVVLTEDEITNGVALTPPYAVAQLVRFVVREKTIAGRDHKTILALVNAITGESRGESTIRNYLRMGTKKKEDRVRNPKWEEVHVGTLILAVEDVAAWKDGRLDRKKTKWAKVVAAMKAHGCNYPFSAQACSAKWAELEEGM